MNYITWWFSNTINQLRWQHIETTLQCVHDLQGIAGHGYYDACTVPIIENTARECELTDRLRQAIKDYPKTQAVLVRRHGVYVWGNTWIQAKTQAECYDYLFESAIKMKSLGIDVSKPAAPITAANGSSHNGHTQNGHAQVAHVQNSHTGTHLVCCLLLPRHCSTSLSYLSTA